MKGDNMASHATQATWVTCDECGRESDYERCGLADIRYELFEKGWTSIKHPNIRNARFDYCPKCKPKK